MEINTKKLPDDVASLKKEITRLQKQTEQDAQTILKLTEENSSLKNAIFGRKSEKFSKEDADQLLLFNEAELIESGLTAEKSETEPEEIVIKEYTRKKAGRKPISDDLPRETIPYDLPDEEKTCPCCQKELPRLDDKVTEELAYIPQKIYVKKHVRYVYGSCKCKGALEKDEPGVKTAPMPPRLIPGSIASPELLAAVSVSKYQDGLPLYRLEKIFSRHGCDISRQTLANWLIGASRACGDLLELMREMIRGGPLIQMDETTVQVLKEKNQAATKKSFMWVTVGYWDWKPVFFYHYHPTRAKGVATDTLAGYTGYLQTDGYAGYHEGVKENNITHVGCFAHVRRKFDTALSGSEKKDTARVGLSHIQKLYKIEKELRKKLSEKMITEQEFEEQRRKKAEPALRNFKKWLEQKSVVVLKDSLIEKAVRYALSEWPKLINYLDKWFLTPDNNLAENAIRPFVIGRKNWLFFTSPLGAHAAATLYSIIETAKANGLEPFSYLCHLFSNLPLAKNREDLINLLPFNLTPDTLQ